MRNENPITKLRFTNMSPIHFELPSLNFDISGVPSSEWKAGVLIQKWRLPKAENF